MPVILADILFLAQHLATLNQERERYQPHQCAGCGRAKPWYHGSYPRKADRTSGVLNPILIPRFFCRYCRKTFSVLPECIPPRRWYLWCIQQAVFLQSLLGTSFQTISADLTVSRSTCRRWMKCFEDQFLLHRSVLLARFPALGLCAETFHMFWQATLKKMSLDRAMLFCHQTGVSIP
jgi:transposase-like protein